MRSCTAASEGWNCWQSTRFAVEVSSQLIYTFAVDRKKGYTVHQQLRKTADVDICAGF